MVGEIERGKKVVVIPFCGDHGLLEEGGGMGPCGREVQVRSEKNSEGRRKRRVKRCRIISREFGSSEKHSFFLDVASLT